MDNMEVQSVDFNGYISFLKEKCDFFNRISSDAEYLYSEINNLKNSQQLDVVLDIYKDSTGPLNILRLFILKCVKYGKVINEQFVQDAKDNFNQNITHIDFQKIFNACKYYDLLKNALECLIG